MTSNEFWKKCKEIAEKKNVPTSYFVGAVVNFLEENIDQIEITNGELIISKKRHYDPSM